MPLKVCIVCIEEDLVVASVHRINDFNNNVLCNGACKYRVSQTCRNVNVSLNVRSSKQFLLLAATLSNVK